MLVATLMARCLRWRCLGLDWHLHVPLYTTMLWPEVLLSETLVTHMHRMHNIHFFLQAYDTFPVSGSSIADIDVHVREAHPSFWRDKQSMQHLVLKTTAPVVVNWQKAFAHAERCVRHCANLRTLHVV